MANCGACGGGGGEISLKKCSGCFSMAYCSPKCQRAHWRVHKDECTPFKVTHDPVLGKQWVATRDLQPGTLLLEERPLIHVPHWWGRKWICLTCGLHMKSPKLCSICRWPICSLDCQKNPTHAENECAIFTNKNLVYVQALEKLSSFGKTQSKKFKMETSDWMAGVLKILRGLRLKGRDPQNYQKLMTDSYIAAYDQFSDCRALQEHQNLARFFTHLINLDELGVGVEEGEILKFIQVVTSNNFESSSPDEEQTRAPLHGPYRLCARMNHSCAPNCHRIFIPFPSLTVKMRTATSVRKGEPLTINYLHNEFELLSRRERNAEIYAAWSFVCQCLRCRDPQELGTLMDGVVCPKCPKGQSSVGYLLPTSPLNFKEDAQWECDACGAFQSYKEISQLTDELARDLKTANVLEAENIQNGGRFLDDFIQKTRGVLVHPNHFIVQRALRDFCQLWSLHFDFPMTRQYFDRAKGRSESLLEIQNILTPGISFMRASTLFKMCALVMEAMREISGKFTHDELETLMKWTLSRQAEAAMFFGYDRQLFKPNEIFSEQLDEFRLVAEAILQNLAKFKKSL